MSNNIIKIAEVFSKFPGGRVRDDGPYSGEAFRQDYIIPSLQNNEKTTIVIDGVMGYGSSFLEECFGGLVRQGLDSKQLESKLVISYEDPAFQIYEQEIWDYIKSSN